MFPIQNEAACALKWSWLTLYLSLDQINMCHRTGGFNLSPDDNFKDFNKHPKLVEERKRMVDGSGLRTVANTANVSKIPAARVKDRFSLR